MLLRNLQPKQGLCNGTHLIFQSLSTNGRVLMCSYKYNGITKETAIPRIVLKPKTNEFPFDWSRRQFPLRVAFACTINKSQGQTMKRIGLWLPSPVFGHGQFNVASVKSWRPSKPHHRYEANYRPARQLYKECCLQRGADGLCCWSTDSCRCL